MWIRCGVCPEPHWPIWQPQTKPISLPSTCHSGMWGAEYHISQNWLLSSSNQYHFQGGQQTLAGTQIRLNCCCWSTVQCCGYCELLLHMKLLKYPREDAVMMMRFLLMGLCKQPRKSKKAEKEDLLVYSSDQRVSLTVSVCTTLEKQHSFCLHFLPWRLLNFKHPAQ